MGGASSGRSQQQAADSSVRRDSSLSHTERAPWVAAEELHGVDGVTQHALCRAGAEPQGSLRGY